MNPKEVRGPADGEGGGDGHWLVRPQTIRVLWIVFIAVLAATVVPDPFIHQHVVFGIEDSLGFYAWYGFITCVAMVLLAKGLGAVFLKRDDRYYGD